MLVLGTPKHKERYYCVGSKCMYDEMCQWGLIPMFSDERGFYFEKDSCDCWLKKTGIFTRILFAFFIKGRGE